MEEKILEIGCGGGRCYKKDNPNIFMDINPNILKELKGKKVIHNANIIPYPFEDNSIDKIYFQHILEHLEIDSYSIMKELYRILKPYGYIYFETPNAVSIAKRVEMLFGTVHPVFHKSHRKYLGYNFTKELCKDLGFYVFEEPYRYLPFKNLAAPLIKFTLYKPT